VLPPWANSVGWALSFTSVAAIPITMLVQLCLRSGTFTEVRPAHRKLEHFLQRLQELLSPDATWGPALAVHRSEQYPLQIPESRKPCRIDGITDQSTAYLTHVDEADEMTFDMDTNYPAERETAI
jgi:hypothetical protein